MKPDWVKVTMDVPVGLRQELRIRAGINDRSMGAEARAIIAHALGFYMPLDEKRREATVEE